MTSITIPNSVTSIAAAAFYNCTSLTAFYGEGNDYYSIDNNRALIVDGGKTLLAYAGANDETSYAIPEGITLIASNAFLKGTKLTSITLPSTLKTINSYAFEACNNLTSITIPSSVTAIGYYAFTYCSSLKEIIIEEGSNLANTIANLGLNGTWLKDGATVTSFTGAGTYIKSEE